MNVLMRHWHDLLYQSGISFFFFLPSLSVPFPHEPQPCSHSRLFSVSVNTDIGHSVWTLALAVRAFFFFFFPLSQCSAWHAGGRLQSGQKLHWWKLRALFVCQLSHPVLSTLPISAPAWFIFSPMLLELFQQTPLDRDMQIFIIGKQPTRPGQPASRAVHELTVVPYGHVIYLFRPRKKA